VKLRPIVRWTHLWVGLILSLLLFVLALSGSALVYKEAWWTVVVPGIEQIDVAPSPMERAAAIAVATERFGDQLRTVKMPEPGVLGAYHLYLAEGEAFLDVGNHAVLDAWGTGERTMSFLFDLHAHLLAGERGEKVGGVIALLAVFLVLSGLVLWWPTRRRTGFRTMIPGSRRRGAWIAAHRDLGFWTSPVVLILCLTGWAIVYYGAAGIILNGIFGDPPVAAEPAPPPSQRPVTGPPDAATLAAVDAAFPEGRMVFWYPPTRGETMHRFRLKQPCELHPNGRSYVFADGAGRVVASTDPCQGPPGERALHAVYPLHAGKTPSAIYRFVTFLGGLALAFLSASGVVAYGGKILRRREG